ncbi:DNA processing protein [Asanoa ferruginea]|uniref:DNA processing protein n=1 Tax=Asanoa ferruginea TaxID=53367 RepID=A0A3D9ZU48_9ACTN|nr:DNA-processing protein DprA [Asanoa ferruginea]REG00919.1 DNA processing protein [Asanoa ferruginea]GIF47502.1 putative DNA processing protein DprA [Asanoa ferruginea]
MEAENIRVARARLGWLFEPGDPTLAQLLATNSPVDAYDLIAAGQVTFTARAELAGLSLPQMCGQAAAAVDDAYQGGRIVIPEDQDWPAGLDDARDWTPVCLWTAGPGAIPQPRQAVTLVGARACTAYGEHVARDLAAGLITHGWAVVSSAAVGIERAALYAALAAEGAAVAVLPHGIDQLLSDQQRQFTNLLAESGLLVSAFPAGAVPRRDRGQLNALYLAILTGGTVVVEAPARASCLAVVASAVRHGRAAMAVPGPVTSAMSTGCHRLLREDRQIRIVTDVDDIIADLRHAFAPVWPRPEADDAPTT